MRKVSDRPGPKKKEKSRVAGILSHRCVLFRYYMHNAHTRARIHTHTRNTDSALAGWLTRDPTRCYTGRSALRGGGGINDL